MSTRTMRTMAAAVLTAVATGLAISACGAEGEATADTAPELPQGGEPTNLDPAAFTTDIDNPYWPMVPGSRWVYRERSPGSTQRVVVTVTDKTKQIANGVEARVVRDVVSEHGELVEVTDDWYAQDSAGNVWYLGEKTAEYEKGKVTTTAGSFEAGVDGAQPGIIMPANPEDGLAYRQEYYAGEAEDRAEVLSTEEQVEVPFGRFTGSVMTKDLVPLEPKVNEHKFYARDVGPVLAVGISGGGGREELIRFQPSATRCE